jgi:hypothetical protein
MQRGTLDAIHSSDAIAPPPPVFRGQIFDHPLFRSPALSQTE